MISCSLIENNQIRSALGIDPQPTALVCMGKFSSLLNSMVFYRHDDDLLFTFDRFSNCLDDQCQQNLSFEKKIFIVSSFRKFVRSQFTNVFPVWTFDHWKAMLRLFSCRHVTLNRFSLFSEHFSRKCEVPSIFFDLISLFFCV